MYSAKRLHLVNIFPYVWTETYDYLCRSLVPVLGVAVPVQRVRKTFHFAAYHPLHHPHLHCMLTPYTYTSLLSMEVHINCIFHLAICNPSCLNGGTCIAPNTCQCITIAWSGNYCQTRE